MTNVGTLAGIDSSGYFYVTSDSINRIDVYLFSLSFFDYSAPSAYFTVSPSEGTTATLFSFDATWCYDDENPDSTLLVRWDWENDGIWDTGYSTTKTITHQFRSEGTWTVKLEVMDSDGKTGSYTRLITVSGSTLETGTMSDMDGNTYRTVKIGKQWWMAENLKVTQYRNGKSLLNISDGASWQSLNYGDYCKYENDAANVAVNGRLYNWFVVSDSRNIAPAGWHACLFLLGFTSRRIFIME